MQCTHPTIVRAQCGGGGISQNKKPSMNQSKFMNFGNVPPPPFAQVRPFPLPHNFSHNFVEA